MEAEKTIEVEIGTDESTTWIHNSTLGAIGSAS
jgi:hypothetical protein